MALITFNPPQGLAEVLNVALSDGRYIRLELGRNEYPDDAAYLLKKSTNKLVKAYQASMNIVVEMDDADGVKSVLTGSSVSPFAPLTANDLGIMPPTGINMDGFGTPSSALSTPTGSQMITPTRIPVEMATAPSGTDPKLVAQQQALLKTQQDSTDITDLTVIVDETVDETVDEEYEEIEEGEELEEDEDEETEDEENARREAAAVAARLAAAKKTTKTTKTTTSKRRSTR